MWGFLSLVFRPITSLKQTRSFFSRQKHFSFKVLYFFSIFLLFAFINFFEIYNINSLNKKISHIQVEQLNNVSNDSFDAKQENLELNVLYKKNKEFLYIFDFLFLIFLIVSYIYLSNSFYLLAETNKKLEEEQLKTNQLDDSFKKKTKYLKMKFISKVNDFLKVKKTFIDHYVNNPSEPVFDLSTSFYYKELSKLQECIQANNVAVWSWDLEKDKIKIDKTAHNFLGIKQGQFFGNYLTLLNFFDSKSKRQIKKDMNFALKNNSNFETYCFVKNENIKNQFLLRGVVQEIENKKQVSGLLIKKNIVTDFSTVFRGFFNQPLALFAIVDQSFCIQHVNDHWSELTGYSIGELKSLPLFTFTHQKEKRFFLNKLHGLKELDDNSSIKTNFLFRKSDGTYICLQTMISFQQNNYFLLANYQGNCSLINTENKTCLTTENHKIQLH